jgi:hypothetical protein
MTATATGTTRGRVRLPFEPLENQLRLQWSPTGNRSNTEFSVVDIATTLHTDRTNVYRWRKAGLTVATADSLSIRAGMHPALLWPDMFGPAAA